MLLILKGLRLTAGEREHMKVAILVVAFGELCISEYHTSSYDHCANDFSLRIVIFRILFNNHSNKICISGLNFLSCGWLMKYWDGDNKNVVTCQWRQMIKQDHLPS